MKYLPLIFLICFAKCTMNNTSNQKEGVHPQKSEVKNKDSLFRYFNPYKKTFKSLVTGKEDYPYYSPKYDNGVLVSYCVYYSDSTYIDTKVEVKNNQTYFIDCNNDILSLPVYPCIKRKVLYNSLIQEFNVNHVGLKEIYRHEVARFYDNIDTAYIFLHDSRGYEYVSDSGGIDIENVKIDRSKIDDIIETQYKEEKDSICVKSKSILTGRVTYKKMYSKKHYDSFSLFEMRSRRIKE